MSSGTLRTDLPRALRAAWFAVAAFFAISALLPSLLPAETLHDVLPACSARLRGQSCMLCGMTTAYLRIAEGDLAGATAANAGALPLYFGSWLNFALASAYCLFKGERCNFLR
jgi:hypothetical protein